MTAEKSSKKEFVEDELQTMLKAIDPNIKSLFYWEDENSKEEYVRIWYENDQKESV